MSEITRSTTRARDPYVHKLRLEAREGAAVEIQPAAPLTDAGPRILAKVIAATIAGGALLLLAGGVVP